MILLHGVILINMEDDGGLDVMPTPFPSPIAVGEVYFRCSLRKEQGDDGGGGVCDMGE